MPADKVLEIADEILMQEAARCRRHTHVRKLAVITLSITLLLWILFGVIYEIEIIQGNSMQKTLHSGQLAVSYRLNDSYGLNDIVILNNGGSRDYIKRIVGVAGDVLDIDVETGVLLRNGTPCMEPYAVGKTLKKKDGITFPVTLGENEVFLSGDNREDSEDSRNWGAVTLDQLRGKIVWK